MLKEETHTPETLTDRELITTFPEARQLVPEKRAEWKHKRVQAQAVVRDMVEMAKSITDPERRWVTEEYLKQATQPHLRLINGHIIRLDRLQALLSGISRSGQIFDDDIQRARRVSMLEVVTQPLRKLSKTYLGSCPIHDDRIPSFYVYPHTNSWYCFGCSKGGDAIAFVRAVHGLSFREAVNYLTHHG